MDGQYSIFDCHTGKKKPYEYTFKRYVGQKVMAHFTSGDIILTVKEIEPYYTICTDDRGREYAGTNCTISPIKEST